MAIKAVRLVAAPISDEDRKRLYQDLKKHPYFSKGTVERNALKLETRDTLETVAKEMRKLGWTKSVGRALGHSTKLTRSDGTWPVTVFATRLGQYSIVFGLNDTDKESLVPTVRTVKYTKLGTVPSDVNKFVERIGTKLGTRLTFDELAFRTFNIKNDDSDRHLWQWKTRIPERTADKSDRAFKSAVIACRALLPNCKMVLTNEDGDRLTKDSKGDKEDPSSQVHACQLTGKVAGRQTIIDLMRDNQPKNFGFLITIICKDEGDIVPPSALRD
jgi:hypothetical protein